MKTKFIHKTLKVIFILSLSFLIFSCAQCEKENQSKTISESNSSVTNSKGEIKHDFEITENTIIKDISGKIITLEKMMDYLDSNEFMVEPVYKKNELSHVQIRKATAEEINLLSTVPDEEEINSLEGDKAPSFKMIDNNGTVLSSENTKGKVVVLNFWFAACKPCINEIHELNEVYEKYAKNNNVVFAAVTFENNKKVTSFLKKYHLKYPVVANDEDVASAFKAQGYPTNLVIGKDGIVSSYISGGFDGIGQEITKQINNQLNN